MSHTLLTAVFTHIGLLLLRSTIILPRSTQLWIGAILGKTAYHFSKKWRNTAKRNISSCFPQLTPAEQQSLVDKHFHSVGISLIETAIAWWATDKQVKDITSISGLEHIDQALNKGQGIILLSAHFTTLEIGGRLLSLYRPLHAMYREQDNPTFNKAMTQGRNSFLQSIIKKKNLKGMLRLLKKNQIVWYAMDQNSSDSSAVFTHFFNIPCSTTSATSKLAQRSGAVVLPFTTKRIKTENRYQLTIHPPFKNFPGTDPADDTQKIMDLFEKEIRESPEQYLWIHRRFKTQPEGLPLFYS